MLLNVVRPADLEVGDTAGLETCATHQQIEPLRESAKNFGLQPFDLKSAMTKFCRIWDKV